ncbi:tRNA-(ms[2]io[6]A)-hydroxylase [Pseudomonas abyssi]|uniref:tRNA-(ms[2]io[6]A)-hydroxylase n=1 Tax=Pseudomonas abyssi TaxID=170540 RepID=UPI003C79A8C1
MIEEIYEFLGCRTPQAWVETALQNQELLLLDHKNNELKAASSALALINRYCEDAELCNYMSKLAREELVHHEQVLKIIKRRGIKLRPVSASRYAAGLKGQISKSEPLRVVDTLIVGAFIEARSCERFAAIASHLDPELEDFYLGLLHSEARHYQNYLKFATKYASGKDIADQLDKIRKVEQGLIESPDQQFRFHSGAPA